jgi:acylphosphatase
MSNTERLHAISEGTVQGVGYRWFVQRTCEKLGLYGWVKNLPNGNVETEVEGRPDALDALIAALKQGPLGARVQHVAATREPIQESERRYTAFQIVM